MVLYYNCLIYLIHIVILLLLVRQGYNSNYGGITFRY